MSRPIDVDRTTGPTGPAPVTGRALRTGGSDDPGPAWAVTGARALALGRVGLGVTALVAPRLPLWPWVGWEAARARPTRLLAQALGARDVALGVGVVLALRRRAPARGWVEAGGLADLGDAAITLLSFRRLPRRSRWAVLAAAGGGALAAPILARRLAPGGGSPGDSPRSDQADGDAPGPADRDPGRLTGSELG